MRVVLLLGFLLSPLLLLAQENAATIKKVPVTSTSAASGKEMFDSYCASCHGLAGKGDGPAAPALKEVPSNLTLLSQKNSGKFPAEKVQAILRQATGTVHGSAEMPVWGPILKSVSSGDAVVLLRTSNLTKYIEGLQAK